MGLRYEYTESLLESDSDEDDIDRQYHEFFPNFFLQRKFNDDLNMNLSEERAGAVLEYLSANMPSLKGRITSKGYGKERPIASNETEEGRAKNRRIDIVITPEWAK